MTAETKTLRAVQWRRLDGTGMEYCTLSERAGGWLLDGIVVQVIEGSPTEVRYRVGCDADWHTRGTSVGLRSGGEE